MRLLYILVFAVTLVHVFNACNSSAISPQTFCDTTCNNDTLKFTGSHSLQPYVFISFNGCNPDTLLWSYQGMGVNRKMGFTDLFNPGIKLNEFYIRCVFNDTSMPGFYSMTATTEGGITLKFLSTKQALWGEAAGLSIIWIRNFLWLKTWRPTPTAEIFL